MADTSPPRRRSASVASNRSRSSRLASHRLSARSRRSRSPSPNDASPSRGRQIQKEWIKEGLAQRKSTAEASPKRDLFPPKFFGMQQQERPIHVGNFDFEQKYPEDTRYQELGPNARVWRVYQDEAEVFDADMVGEARDSLDVLLVFAGLFSAVLTTFVAQTSQSLTTDFASISTSALIEIALVLRAQTDGSSLDSIPTTVPTSSPSGLDVWVNGLWFVSLALSLGAALLAVLVKQWLRQYMSRISGTVRDRSHIRQYRFEGIQRWHVLTFVAVMPIILHVAVGLFLAGLVLFLVPLRPVIAGLVGAITMIIYATYIITNVLPLFRVQCPYRTPFSDVLHAIRHGIRSLFKPQGFIITLRDAERLAVTSINITEDACLGALEWLLSITTNPPTQNIVLQSLGAFSPAMTERLQRSPTNFVIPGELVDECLTSDGKLSFAVIPGSEARIERILRSCLHLPSSRRSAYRLISGVTDPALQAVMILNNLPVARMGYQLWTSSLPFLEHTILVHPEGVSVLPRLIWDALVRAAIHDIVSLRDDLPLLNPEFRLKLCKIVYQTFNTPLPLTMESENLLPIGYALDDLLPHILWPHMDVSYPTAHRLEVMLTVSDYLSSIDNPLDTSLRMVSATWQALENLDLDNVEHRRLLRRKTKELLLGSSFLNPHKWKGVSRRERQHLPRCWLAILRVYHKVGVFDTELPYQSITSRTILRSVVELARSISPDMSTEIVDKLWIFALECDHPQGFEAVLEDDILGSLPLPDAWTTTAKRVATFISGLVRLLDVDLWAPYVEYVMEPEHLFHACLMLAAAPNADQLRDLIQLSPENSSWAYARQRLRVYLDEHPSERYAAQEALPRPIQLSTLPVPMDDRLQFLRGLERVYRGIEDHFRAEHPVVPDTRTMTMSRRVKMFSRRTFFRDKPDGSPGDQV